MMRTATVVTITLVVASCHSEPAAIEPEPTPAPEVAPPEAGGDPGPPTHPGIGDNAAGAPCTANDRCGPELGCSGLYFDAQGTCIPATEAAARCTGEGGEWGRWGMMGAMYCMRVNKDADKPCKDGDECVGDCIAQDDGSGKCQRHETQFGCYSTLEDGKVGGGICRD